MNHPTSPTENNPRLCLLADNTNSVPLADGVALPWLPSVIDYNTFLVNPISGLNYIAQKAGFHRFNASAEAQGVTDFRINLLDASRPPGTQYGGKSNGSAPDRLIATVRRTLYLNLGDVVQFTIEQFGQPAASTWPDADGNFLEVEYLG